MTTTKQWKVKGSEPMGFERSSGLRVLFKRGETFRLERDILPPDVEREDGRLKPFSTITSIAIAFLSFLTIVDSSISSLNASRYHDHIGAALQLPTIVVSSLFLLYALAALLSNLTHFLPLPPSILNLIAPFGFGQKFLLFYLQRKDPDRIENRYFNILLVPISICVGSTLVELGYPDPD
ncbi:hypothetical protein MRB53_023440 [Persea americana]|uniref:Uncharacterized protein n=1 Tax=Persea americana TaxID=3435 RepID=A0ACC2L9E2_PERAE|nr:hypothetical protein MRB53_023440 [Persea americana]